MVRAGAKVWRNNVGVAIAGKHKMLPDGTLIYMPGRTPFKVRLGTYIVFGGSVIRFGLCPGSPDLAGYLPVTITSEMVGRKIAVFVGAEAKDIDGRPSDEQRKFIAVAEADGAICFEFRSVAEALEKMRV